MSANLRSALGDDGYSALVQRAAASAELRHPVLGQLSDSGQRAVDLPAMVESADAQTAPAVAAAVESLLEVLVDSLSRLIGADMTLSLLDHDSRSPSHRVKKNDHE